MLVIHAPNVHQGGGRTLLLALLDAANQEHCLAVVDQRLNCPNKFVPMIVHRTKTSLRGRLCAEWRLHRLARRGDTVLCFGNLPPLFPNRACVVLFVQNIYVLSDVDTSGFPLQSRLRILLERFWVRTLHRQASKIIVQTDSVRRAVERVLKRPADVLPFVADPTGYTRTAARHRDGRQAAFDFIYVASGDPHKNHANLLEAWVILAHEGHFPSLCLTIDNRQTPELALRIMAVRDKYQLHIENRICSAILDTGKLYQQADALIYPSMLESLGLPLIEAASIGLPILASEKDFVRDVVDPVESFDPVSPLSIARAVKRHLGIDLPALPVASARSFLDALSGGA
jgi:glycosyltransferase involved in cell wall biosynthesis